MASRDTSVFVCTNCNAVVKGNYCNQCGQKKFNNQALSAPSFLKETFHIFTLVRNPRTYQQIFNSRKDSMVEILRNRFFGQYLMALLFIITSLYNVSIRRIYDFKKWLAVALECHYDLAGQCF
jgi:hypothetical protein